MNNYHLSKTIRRDGLVIHYLIVPEPVEEKKPSMLSVFIKKMKKKILPLSVRKVNRKNKHN